jgi:beta-galactosidase
VLTALAYGLRGFNIYMAVERDRWIGAPIDPHGRARPFAAFWRRLIAAMERTRFFDLRRPAPVRIVTPRAERRLARVLHAFGPITGAFFSVAGSGAREAVAEDELGLGYPVGIEADAFVHTLEHALEARGVPFAHVGGEDRDVSLDGARWILCASSGGMNPALFQRLELAAAGGARVTIGPREPTFDGAFRALPSAFDLAALRTPGAPGTPGSASDDVPVLLSDDPAAADAAVARAIDALGLPAFACDPGGVFATVHEDAAGQPRVLFVIHPGEDDLIARVTVGGAAARAIDLLDDSVHEARRGAFEVRMKPRSVRMLAIEG